jgi:hypothetical protein
VSFVVCVVLFECGVLFCVVCVICVLCLAAVPLPLGKNPFAVIIIIIIRHDTVIWPPLCCLPTPTSRFSAQEAMLKIYGNMKG